MTVDQQIALANRVQAGATMLDKQMPNWYNRIKEKVDIGSGFDCVLGQLYHTYPRGTIVLGLNQWECYDFGFLCFEPGKPHKTGNPRHADVEREWEYQIAIRKQREEDASCR